MKKNETPTELLLNTLVESVKERKAEKIVSLNLRNLEQAVCDYFIVCEAQSTTQVDAIAQFAEKEAKEKLGEYALHVVGKRNAQWVLLDYGDVVLHVFLREKREFYRLEALWADATVTHHND